MIQENDKFFIPEDIKAMSSEELKRKMAQQFLIGELDTSNLDRHIIRELKQYIENNNITISASKIKEIKQKQQQEVTLYRRNEIYTSLSKEGFLPEKFNLKVINKVLEKNGLISINDKNRTIATDYSISNNYFIISKIIHYGDDDTGYEYYITEEGKAIIEECIKMHPAEFYILN